MPTIHEHPPAEKNDSSNSRIDQAAKWHRFKGKAGAIGRAQDYRRAGAGSPQPSPRRRSVVQHVAG
jgi:hypothetical protein